MLNGKKQPWDGRRTDRDTFAVDAQVLAVSSSRQPLFSDRTGNLQLVTRHASGLVDRKLDFGAALPFGDDGFVDLDSFRQPIELQFNGIIQTAMPSDLDFKIRRLSLARGQRVRRNAQFEVCFIRLNFKSVHEVVAALSTKPQIGQFQPVQAVTRRCPGEACDHVLS